MPITWLVAIVALTASTVPELAPPNTLPPAADAVASMVAVIVALSIAATVTAPALLVCSNRT